MAIRRRSDLAWLALIATVVRLPAILSSRHLSFDDGVYGSTAVAIRDGARPYRDVFSSQGPLHLPLVYLADLIGFRTLDAPRLLSLAAGIAITLCTYLIARRVAGRRAGLVAGMLATTSGSLFLVTTGVSGDGPTIAFAVGAVTVAFAYYDRPSTGKAVAVGLLVGATLAVKLLAAPVVIPVALLLGAHRRRRDVLIAAGVAVALVAACTLPWGVHRVWDQSVRYHRKARRYSVGSAAWRVVSTLFQRDTFVTFTALLAATLALLRRGSRPAARDDVPLATVRWVRPGTLFGLWLGAQIAMLLAESAMWRPHVSELIVPLCLLAALRLPSMRALVVAWLVAMPIFVVGTYGFVRPGGYRGNDAALARRLDQLPDGARVVGDEPGFAWRTGHRVPDHFVDTSVQQLEQGRIMERDILDAAKDPRTCAVVVWAHERFGQFPALGDDLDALGYDRTDHFGDGRALYRRSDCRG